VIHLSRRSLLSACPLLAAGLGLYACGDDSVATVDETAVLKDLADIVARPSYAALKAASDGFKVAADAFVASPSEATIGAAQENWKATMTSWNQTRTFAFGPAKDIEPNIRWHLGADVDPIEETITAGPPFDAAALGTSRKGLPALEYLLFDPEGGNAAILEKFSASADRVAFAGALAADLSAQIDALVSAWDAHATELASAGVGSEIYKAPKDGMDALYNQLLYVADLAIAQIKDPLLGSKGTGGLSPELEEARLSDNTLADTLAQIAAVSSAFEGSYGDGTGLGISALVKDRSPELDDELRSAIAAAKAAVEAIPPPLREALEGDLGVLNTAFESLREVKRLLNSDVATALGVTISFSDMDGD
jgi:predicted lipoprotein